MRRVGRLGEACERRVSRRCLSGLREFYLPTQYWVGGTYDMSVYGTFDPTAPDPDMHARSLNVQAVGPVESVAS